MDVNELALPYIIRVRGSRRSRTINFSDCIFFIYLSLLVFVYFPWQYIKIVIPLFVILCSVYSYYKKKLGRYKTQKVSL